MVAPTFSAVVIASKSAVHLEAALQSLYDQDYPAIEIIGVHGSSAAAVTESLRQLLDGSGIRSRFERIVTVEIGDACERRDAIDAGVRASRGDFVSVLGPDDLFAKDRVSRLLNACAARGAEVAFSRVQPVDDLPASREEVEHVYSVQDDIGVFPTVGFALLRQDCVLATGNLVFHRRAYERLHGFCDVESVEAWDFALRSVAVAEPAYLPEPLFAYRVRGPARFSAQRGARESERDEVRRRYLFLCRNHPVDNPLAPSPAWGPFFEAFLQTSRCTVSRG